MIVALDVIQTTGGPPWLAPGCASRRGRSRWRAAARSSVVYVFFLVRLAGLARGEAHLRRRLDRAARRRSTDPDVHRTRCKLTAVVALVAVRDQPGLRRRHVAAAGALRVPRQAAAVSALIDLPLAVSPVVVGLALVLVYNPRTGWFGPTLERRRHPGHLRHPRHDHGDRVRRAAAGDPRGGPGARGDRRRAGAGGAQPRRQRRADVPPDHPADASSGPSCTASCSAWPARSASSARSRSSPATSCGRPRPRRWSSSRSTRTSTRARAYATAFLLAAASVLCIVVVSLLPSRRKQQS